jgi:SAM-dependent methyltransferase
MTKEFPDYVVRNRSYWDGVAQDWVAGGERDWASEPCWGVWRIPESQLGILPDLTDKDTIELGCGTGYVSSWLARRGARPIGIDNSAAQLATAQRLQVEHGIAFPLIHGNAESVPYPDESFDFAISEYGAAIWCDPFVWIPEAARLLRRGGRLVFLCGSPLNIVCSPDDEAEPMATTLLRPYFGMHRCEWPDTEGVEFHLEHGRMLRLLQDSGFSVADLIEIQAPEGPDDERFQIPRHWAWQWPAEDVWIADRVR